MKINHISVSRKQCYELCPMQYRFRYHNEIKSPEPEPEYFLYGKIMHKCAQEYVEHRGKMMLDEIAHDILKGRIPLDTDREGNKKVAQPLSLEYRKRMPDELKSLQDLFDKVGTDGQTEYNFSFDLNPPNQCLIVGFIDWFFKVGDQYFIVDYKTTKIGKWRENEWGIVNNLQLRAYARVVQKNFGVKAENITAALYYLQGGDLVSAQFDHKSLVEAERDLLATYREIKDADPDKVRAHPGEHCRRCDYRSICQFK